MGGSKHRRNSALPSVAGGDAVRSTMRGAGLLTTAQVVVGLGNYGYSLMLARLLAPKLFGNFAAAQGMVLVCGTLATASVPWVVAQVFATASGPAARRDVIWFSLVTNVLQGAVAAVVVVAARRARHPARYRPHPVATRPAARRNTVRAFLRGPRRARWWDTSSDRGCSAGSAGRPARAPGAGAAHPPGTGPLHRAGRGRSRRPRRRHSRRTGPRQDRSNDGRPGRR